MSRKRPFGLAVAQLGPIQKAESRASAVSRLLEMMKEAKSRGAKLVVFPELALTTFFPALLDERGRGHQPLFRDDDAKHGNAGAV